MAKPESIVAALESALAERGGSDPRVMERAAAASFHGNTDAWERVRKALDEGRVGIDARALKSGDSFLHFAAGGEGQVRDHHIQRGVVNVEVAKGLWKRGIEVNALNAYGFSSLRVAILNGSLELVEVLLDAGARARSFLSRNT